MRPFTEGRFRALDAAGVPINGAKLFSYESQSTTPQDTYTTADLNVANTNPVVTNANGYASVWLDPEKSYRLILKSADESITYWDTDKVTDGYAIEDLTYSPGWTGSVSSTAADALRREIWVEDFGAVGDNSTDSYAAIQAAIDYAESLIGTSQYNDNSVTIRFGRGRFRTSQTLRIKKGGLALVGQKGRGTVLICNSGCLTLIDLGEYVTTSYRPVRNHFESLILTASDTSASNTAIKAYRASQFKMTDCVTVNFWTHVHFQRVTQCWINDCQFLNNSRQAQARALMRFEGLDESTFATPNSYTPGGGYHITDCEFNGDASVCDTDAGMEVQSVDGLYVTQCHFTGCVRTIYLCPEGSAANRTIADVVLTSLYFDEPSTFATTPECFVIGGSVKQSITLASGATQSSTYQSIRVVNSYFRANYEALRCVLIEVEDLDSWWDIGDKSLRDIVFNGCTFRQAQNCAFQIRGATTSPPNTYVEPTGLRIIGNLFENNNGNGATGAASDILAQCESVVIANNVFLPAYTSAADYVCWVVPTDDGDDYPQPSCVVTGNDFSRATAYTVRPLEVSRTGVNVSVNVSDNLMPGAGKELSESYKVQTPGATPTTLWSYLIPENTAGAFDVIVTAANSSATRRVAYSWRVGFYRASGGSAILDGLTSMLAMKDTTTPAPTLALSGNTLTLEVTGVAATQIDWHATVKGVFAR